MKHIKINNWQWNIDTPDILDGWFDDFKTDLSVSKAPTDIDCTPETTRLTSLCGVKSNSERDVFRFEHNGRGYFAKYAHPASLFQKVRSIVSPKLAAEFESINLLSDLGIPVVKVCGWGSCGSESMLITEELRDSQSVRDYWFTVAVKDDKLRNSFLANFADFLKKFFDAGIYHPDFHPGNIMIVRDSQMFVLVDPYGVVEKENVSDSELFEMLCIIGAFRGEVHDDEGAEFIRKVLDFSSDESMKKWQDILKHETEKSEKLWVKRKPKALTDLRNSQLFRKDNCEVRIRKSIVREFFVNPDKISGIEDTDQYIPRELSHENAEKEWLNSLYLQIHRIPHRYPIVWFSKTGSDDKLYFEKEMDTILNEEEIKARRSFIL